MSGCIWLTAAPTPVKRDSQHHGGYVDQIAKTAEPVVPLEVVLRVSHIKRAFNSVPTVPKATRPGRVSRRSAIRPRYVDERRRVTVRRRAVRSPSLLRFTGPRQALPALAGRHLPLPAPITSRWLSSHLPVGGSVKPMTGRRRY
jgi:hypothetical protein